MNSFKRKCINYYIQEQQHLKRQVALVCQICVVKWVQLQFAHSHAVFCGGRGRAKDMMPLYYMSGFHLYIHLYLYLYLYMYEYKYIHVYLCVHVFVLSRTRQVSLRTVKRTDTRVSGRQLLARYHAPDNGSL